MAADKDAKRRAELAERAQRSADLHQRVPLGGVANAEPGWVYVKLHTRGRNQNNLNVLRDRLEASGAEPLGGPRYKGAEPRPEFDPRHSQVELWRRPQEAQDVLDRARQKRALDPRRCPHWIEIQRGRTRPGGMLPPWAQQSLVDHEREQQSKARRGRGV